MANRPEGQDGMRSGVSDPGKAFSAVLLLAVLASANCGGPRTAVRTGIASEESHAEMVTVRPVEIQDVLRNPGKGFADFHFGDGMPPLPGMYPQPTVAYFRWTWAELEPAEGKFNFGIVDNAIREAKSRGETLAFRIMPVYRGSTPQWVLDRGVDAIRVGGDVFPDHNDPVFLRYHERLVRAFGERYDGRPEIDHVDIGSVGCWGEWNTACCFGKAKRTCKRFFPSLLNKRLITDWYLHAFPRTPLVMLAGGPTEYAASHGAGWRGDCYGDYGYFNPVWNHMSNVYERIARNAVSGRAWRAGPVQLEVCGVMEDWYERGFDIDRILRKGLEWHASVLNAKSSPVPGAWRGKMNRFVKRLGYRFVLREITHTGIVVPGGTLLVRSRWENVGVAPIYRPWPLAYRLRPVSGPGRAAATWLSRADLRQWLPGPHSVEDHLTIPGGTASGTYVLEVAILNQAATAAYVEIAIEGKRPDKWYPVSRVEVKNMKENRDKEI